MQCLRALKVESFLPNYGFYGPQQPVAASGKPSSFDDFAVRSGTCLSHRRKTRTASNDRRPAHQTGLLTETPLVKWKAGSDHRPRCGNYDRCDETLYGRAEALATFVQVWVCRDPVSRSRTGIFRCHVRLVLPIFSDDITQKRVAGEDCFRMRD
jgi:hypothetical protein